MAAVTGERWLLPHEAAALLHVSPKTVARWAREGKLASVRTLGGHRRFSVAEVERVEAEQRGEDR